MSEKRKSPARQPTFANPVLHDRFTGKILRVGCQSDPSEFLATDVCPSQVLWRYMNLAKFRSLLETRSIYFRRLDRLRTDGSEPDHLEGKLAPDGSKELTNIDYQIANSLGHKLSSEEVIEGYEIHAACSWVSCWTMKNFEDWRMWQVYSPEQTSVAIRSNVRRLKHSLKASRLPLAFGKVLYTQPEIPRPIMTGWTAPIFRKPDRFEWEQEFRILRNLGRGETMPHNDPEWYGRFERVNLRCLVGQIRTHPNASDSNSNEIRKLVEKHAPTLLSRIRRSTLL